MNDIMGFFAKHLAAVVSIGGIIALVLLILGDIFAVRWLRRRRQSRVPASGNAQTGAQLGKGAVLAIMVVNVVLIFAGIVGGKLFVVISGFKAMAAGGEPSQTVSTAVAATDRWNDSLDAVGSLRAVKGVDLSGEVAGIVDEIHFESGDTAKEGDLLVKLRANDDIAKLDSLQASVKLADANYQRDLKQLKTQAIAEATVVADSAALDIAKAQAQEQQALLDKKFIHAPFAGVLGVRAVDLGQYLNPGTAIVTLQQIDPIYFDFYLPQQSLSQISTGQKITVKNDTYPDKDFEGEISAISPKVDTATRNVQVRATLHNADHKLLPGMYATAKILVGEPQQYITLPQTAITYNPYGSTVYLVEDKSKDDKGEPKLSVKQSLVTTGPVRGDQVAVLKGLSAGDTVVVSGQNKLHTGAPIIVNNTILPTSDPNPKPQEQ